MSFRFKLPAITALAATFIAMPAFAQMAFIQGTVTDADSKVVAGAVVAFDSISDKSHNEVKSDKKGHYITNMKAGPYSITVTVDGKLRDVIDHFDAVPNNSDAVNFKLKAGNVAILPPGNAGKEAADKAAKDREAQLAKNKDLNDSFGAGRTAIENKQWDEAITQLTKAADLGPTQPAVWASLAEAYVGSAKVAKGADVAPIYDKAFVAYEKVLTITPDDAGSYNNYALALAYDKKIDDAKVKLAKAVELDPAGAGKYHYNLGALLMNSNQTDAAIEEFKKAIEADPNYAEAYYYYGSTMVGKATLDQATGKMTAPPGTIEALQKYLQLKPDGPNAQPAKDLIAALGSSVQTNYKDPNAPAKPAKKK